jgi:hypothetical protein
MAPIQLQRDLAFWIEGYYNRERRHSMIGYLSSIVDEQQFVSAYKTLSRSDESCPRNRGNPTPCLPGGYRCAGSDF